MNIAILTFDFFPQTGGVQTYLWEISKGLSSRHSIYILTTAPGGIPKGVNIKKITPNGLHAFAFYQKLRQIKPDIVLVGHTHPQLLLAAYLYRRQRFAFIAYGNDYHAAQMKWHRPIFNWLLKQANVPITITKMNAERLEKIGVKKPTIIYPGTDPEKFQPVSNSKLDHTNYQILTISRLVPRKGIDTTLQILPQLLTRHPNLTYLIGGSGPDLTRLQQLVMELNLDNVVSFLGFIPDEELVTRYNNATIFVMPSREIEATGSIEGFGIVYLEASACGVPVIAGRTGGAIEAVIDGKTGFLVDPDEPDQLLEAISKLLSNPGLKKEMGIAGREWVIDEMNWKQAVNKFEEVLQTLTDEQ